MYPQDSRAGYAPFLKPQQAFCETAEALQAAMYTGDTRVTAIRFWPGTAGGAVFLADVAQKMPWVSWLDFTNINQEGAAPTFREEDFLAVVHLFPRLAALDFSCRYGPLHQCGVRVTASGLRSMLRHLPQLTRLSFFHQSMAGGEAVLAHIGQLCPMLQHLDFGYCRFNATDIIECARGCRYLELLDLRESNCSTKDLMTLLALLPRLRFVDCRESRIDSRQVVPRHLQKSHPNILLDF